MTYSKIDCINGLRRAYETLGHSPTYDEYRELDISPSTSVIVDRFGTFNEAKAAAALDTEKQPNERYLYHGYHEEGYEVIANTLDGERREVKVHRLVAVAKYGFDKVCGNVVHHRNHMKKDNSHDNIGLMNRADHTSQHQSE